MTAEEREQQVRNIMCICRCDRDRAETLLERERLIEMRREGRRRRARLYAAFAGVGE